MFAWLRRLFVRPADTPEAIGRLGEGVAADYLQGKGFSVLVRNWRHKKDEIDLVCEDCGILVFVEVKTRSAGALVSGYDAIDRRKKDALLRVCRAYLHSLRPAPKTHRFDVVEIEHAGGKAQDIRHFEDVPLFNKAVGRGN